MKKGLFFLLLLAFVTACVVPCVSAQQQASGKPRYGGVLKWTHNGAISNIASPTDGALLMRNTRPVFETLLNTDDRERIQPGLAESCTVSPDGKIITLHLRKGVKFHDGTEFNAAAVKFNLELAKKNNIPSATVLKNVASYDIVDPYTLRLSLSHYDCRLLLRLAQSPLGQMASPQALQKETTPDKLVQAHMVGTGPFKFDSWQRDSFVKFVKWDGYWQKGRPYLDGIEIKTIIDTTVSIMAFKAGETRMVENIDPVDALTLKAEGFEMYTPSTVHFIHSICPDGANQDSPFANKKVREALEYAINKEEMAAGIGMGFYEVTTQFASVKDPFYTPGLKPRKYDPKMARKLLAEAGYPDGVKTTLVADVRKRKDELVAIQTYLKDAGFDCTLDMASVARITEMSMKGWKGILMFGFPTVANTNGLVTRFSQDYPSMYRPAGWQEKWDALIAEPDQEKRTVKMKELVKIMYDEAIVVPTHTDSPRSALNGTIKDMNWHGRGTVDYYDVANVWVTK
jgi:peptide/nickel transport system substrate-binding protein